MNTSCTICLYDYLINIVNIKIMSWEFFLQNFIVPF